jgi:hypothetical protein
MSDDESVLNGYGRETADQDRRLRTPQSASVNGDEFSEDDADLFGDGDDAPDDELNK